jgi:hypothetical protein
VAATTESHVNVNAIGLDIQPVDTLLEEYRNMISLCRDDHLL